ncbi:hypothetical protein AB0I27_22355 [Streptomyces sp. NPDC050597]|uniref:hypothetical protein n=1 Tax=Streptomyces sp. NPDC050597 TaxID=3157212 RepID=UPI00343C6FB1
MPAYADHDAEQVARGIRLGGRGQILDEAPAGPPLTVAGLERLTRPDIYEPDEELDEDEDPPTWGAGGQLQVHQASDTYTLSAAWWGWLPGHYVTRDAALVAYGYVLGGEKTGPLDKLAQPRLEGYTLAEIETFAAA